MTTAAAPVTPVAARTVAALLRPVSETQHRRSGSPIGGTLIDRLGPRPVMIVGLTTEAFGVASLALVQNAWHALAVATFITLGTVGLYPASTNAGLGIGGVVSALLVRVADPSSFERLYLVDALS